MFERTASIAACARSSDKPATRPMVESLESRQLYSGDMVLAWNQVLLNALRTDTTQLGPSRVARNLAVVQTSVYDAVNGIGGHFAQYLNVSQGPRHASLPAAAAEAAYEALVNIYPFQKDSFDANLQMTLGGIPDGKAKTDAMAYGKQVADAILAARANDGSDAIVTYTAGTQPGQWRPDPLNPNQKVWGAGQGMVIPFSLESGAQFRPPAPPALTSQQYADDLNLVEAIGAKNSTMRSAEQTQIANFWAYDRTGMGYPIVHYDQAVLVVAQQKHNSLLANARLLALFGIAQADAGIAAWDSKFTYNFWRPITAIREADTDGNPATVADPNWVPLGSPGDGVVPDFTPPFPAYISGHSTFGAAAFGVLAAFYHTDHMTFTLTSDEMPGVTRTYHSFSQAADENGESRIYLGVHWPFDNEYGKSVGRSVAQWVMGHELKARR